MDLLIGVYHDPRYLSDVEKLLRYKFPGGLESLMLEIPSDFDILRSVYSTVYGREYKFIGNTFYTPLAERFRQTGTTIIYGDTPLGIDNKELLDGKNYERNLYLKALRRYLTKSDDKYMIKKIEETNPVAVAVCRIHTDRIKRMFPNVHYIAHSPRNRFTRLFVNDSLPDKIIPVDVC